MPHKFILAMEAAAYAYTAWRLVARGLAARQTALLSFLIFRCITMVLSTFLPETSPIYFWFYVILMPMDSIVSMIAVREAIGLVLDDYPGLRSVGRWTMYGAVAVAVVAALLIGAAFWRTEVSSNVYYIQVSSRSAVFGLAVVLVSLLIFLSHYPLSLTRNRRVSTFAFGAIFLSEAIALFIDTRAEAFRVPAVDLASIGFGAICLLAWGALLQPKETEAIAKPSGPRDERLLQQLKSMEQLARKLGQAG